MTFRSDVIAKQVRVSGAFYPGMTYDKPFDVPVVYEDDHMAVGEYLFFFLGFVSCISFNSNPSKTFFFFAKSSNLLPVNKPAGVITYRRKSEGQSNRQSLSGALPFCLRPPSEGTIAILRKPAPVHRLDKPTSGLMLVAKTKPAMIDLSQQFADRRVKKTYTAIVNGIPDEPKESRISKDDAKAKGVHIPCSNNEDDENWQLIDFSLDGKHAITIWRPLQYAKSLKADQGYLTMVELKPKTGRYHQVSYYIM